MHNGFSTTLRIAAILTASFLAAGSSQRIIFFSISSFSSTDSDASNLVFIKTYTNIIQESLAYAMHCK